MSTKLTLRTTWTFEIEVLPTLEIGGGLGPDPDPDPQPALRANTTTIRANRATARANGFSGA